MFSRKRWLAQSQIDKYFVTSLSGNPVQVICHFNVYTGSVYLSTAETPAHNAQVIVAPIIFILVVNAATWVPLAGVRSRWVCYDS